MITTGWQGRRRPASSVRRCLLAANSPASYAVPRCCNAETATRQQECRNMVSTSLYGFTRCARCASTTTMLLAQQEQETRQLFVAGVWVALHALRRAWCLCVCGPCDQTGQQKASSFYNKHNKQRTTDHDNKQAPPQQAKNHTRTNSAWLVS